MTDPIKTYGKMLPASFRMKKFNSRSLNRAKELIFLILNQLQKYGKDSLFPI